MPRCTDVIQHTTYRSRSITILSLLVLLYIFILAVSSIVPVACKKFSKENAFNIKETRATQSRINNHVTRRMTNNIMLVKPRNNMEHAYLYHRVKIYSVAPLTNVYKISDRSLQKAHYLDSSILKWRNRKLLSFQEHLDGSDFVEYKHRHGPSKTYKKRFARLKSNVKGKKKIGDLVRRSILVDPVQSKALNLTLDSKGFVKKLNFSEYKSFLHELNLSRRVMDIALSPTNKDHNILKRDHMDNSVSYQLVTNDLSESALDAERAFLCIVCITLTIMAAVWAAGMCRVRRHSAWNVLDFESSQPLTTVKDAILRKSKYLPMFADYYRNQDKRRKDLFLDC